MPNACKVLLLAALVVCPALAQTGPSAGPSSAPRAKDAAVPFDSRCMAGQWHEQVDNPFRWIFEVRDDRLKIWRTDRFVSGNFRRKGNTWEGELRWGNGESWRNVLLTPTPDCQEIHTNQSWSFKRN